MQAAEQVEPWLAFQKPGRHLGRLAKALGLPRCLGKLAMDPVFRPWFGVLSRAWRHGSGVLRPGSGVGGVGSGSGVLVPCFLLLSIEASFKCGMPLGGFAATEPQPDVSFVKEGDVGGAVQP